MLTECRECGKRVSTQALSCPDCGAFFPKKKVYKKSVWAAGFMILIGVVGLMPHGGSRETDNPSSIMALVFLLGGVFWWVYTRRRAG